MPGLSFDLNTPACQSSAINFNMQPCAEREHVEQTESFSDYHREDRHGWRIKRRSHHDYRGRGRYYDPYVYYPRYYYPYAQPYHF